MSWAWIIVLFIVVDVSVACGAIATCIRLLWHPLHLTYPPQAPADDAVRKELQSFRVGALNLSYSIHVAVDETRLHLTPAKLLRWMGAKPVSIPWDEIELIKRSRFTKSATIRIGKRRIVGPIWCLQIAEPAESSERTASDEEADLTHEPATGPNHEPLSEADRAR